MSAPAPVVRVLVVDDDALVRAALAMVLGGAGDLELVGEAADGDEVLAAVEAVRPDVVLMDVRMARVDGVVATRDLRARPDPPAVLVLTTFSADEQVIAALRAGASGFVLKDTPPADLVEAVRRTARGDPVLSPSVTRRLMERVAGPLDGVRGAGAPADAEEADRTAARGRLARLSERELEVARAVGRGLPNAAIGAELFMSTATVKAYVSKLLLKLELDNRVQVALLVRDADEHRLTGH